MTSELDVVVLGGGGHVGLPLSLAFAQAGLRVGIYDISQPALDRIAAGEMPFKENGADELLSELLPTGRLEMSTDGSILATTRLMPMAMGMLISRHVGKSNPTAINMADAAARLALRLIAGRPRPRR